MPLADKLKNVRKPREERREPLWKGPQVDGVTFSMLSRFLVCRERFRVYAIEGVRPIPEFNHRIEYGSMWHVCEEYHSATKSWEDGLRMYAQKLCIKYQTQQNEIQHWYNVCKTQFPIYLKFWESHSDVKSRIPLLHEEVFCVSYPLPSGRIVKLRGRFDGVDLIGGKKDHGMYLYEIKSKGDIDEVQLQRQLTFDLQTMLYLVALQRREGETLKYPLRGVRYNVVRRPLSGGKDTIKQHQPSKSNPGGETAEEFYSRLGGLISDHPEHYFMRWRVEVTPKDIGRFEEQCLVPVLEELCTWYEDVTYKPFAFSTHYRTPYGVYNALLEGRQTELDEYLLSGSMSGLERAEELFTELK